MVGIAVLQKIFIIASQTALLVVDLMTSASNNFELWQIIKSTYWWPLELFWIGPKISVDIVWNKLSFLITGLIIVLSNLVCFLMSWQFLQFLQYNLTSLFIVGQKNTDVNLCKVFLYDMWFAKIESCPSCIASFLLLVG